MVASREIVLDGYRFALNEEGEGLPPVLLVHGSQSDLRTWSTVMDTLAEGRRVVAYSRRYHWPNAIIPEDAAYEMEGHVGDLEHLLAALELGPVCLVGHSYGAFVCLLMALRRPEQVAALVLVEPPVLTLLASDPPRPLEIARLFFSRPRTAGVLVKFGATGIGPATAAAKRGDLAAALRVMGRAVLGSEAFDALSEQRLKQARDNTIRAEFVSGGFPALSDDEVRGLDCPVLVVNGDRSPPVFHCLADRLLELLPRVEHATIPDASHLVHEDNPGAFLATVVGFVGKHAEGQQQWRA